MKVYHINTSNIHSMRNTKIFLAWFDDARWWWSQFHLSFYGRTVVVYLCVLLLHCYIHIHLIYECYIANAALHIVAIDARCTTNMSIPFVYFALHFAHSIQNSESPIGNFSDDANSTQTRFQKIFSEAIAH